MIEDREHHGQRALSVSWTFTRGRPTVTDASWHALGPIVMCVYIVPEEGEERRSGSSHFFFFFAKQDWY